MAVRSPKNAWSIPRQEQPRERTRNGISQPTSTPGGEGARETLHPHHALGCRGACSGRASLCFQGQIGGRQEGDTKDSSPAPPHLQPGHPDRDPSTPTASRGARLWWSRLPAQPPPWTCTPSRTRAVDTAAQTAHLGTLRHTIVPALQVQHFSKTELDYFSILNRYVN